MSAPEACPDCRGPCESWELDGNQCGLEPDELEEHEMFDPPSPENEAATAEDWTADR